MQVVEACLATRAVNGGLLELGSLRRYVSVRVKPFTLMLLLTLLTPCPMLLPAASPQEVTCLSCTECERLLSATGMHLRTFRQLATAR